MPTHHRLNRLREHLPVPIQIRRHRVRVRLELRSTPQRALVRDHGVPEPGAEVAQHRGVGEVALPPRHRELGAQVFEHRVRESDVPLAVLEVDRVYLVRHRAAADLARDRLLLEVPDGDVTPDVSIEVQDDGVKPR